MAARHFLIAGGLTVATAAVLTVAEPALALLRAPSDAAVAATSAPLPPMEVQRTLTLARGETLAAALRKAGFTPQQTAALTAAAPAAAIPVKAKTDLTLNYTESAPYTIQSATLTYRPEPAQELTLRYENGHATARAVAKPLRDERAVAVGTITSSLYQDALSAGMSPQQVNEFMGIFAWDLDYTRDLHPGDTFKVMFEHTVNDKGQRVKTGRILGAEFKVGKEVRHAYWFNGEYLNEKGESKRKLLLRTPLEFSRISSNFGARKHPVLGFTRMHKGTDFAAGYGTPVKASGDGTVVFVGPHGGHGNFVKIRHNATYTTGYAHLQKFARNLRVGGKVRQGQIIAYVGSTGISTGPHLHYEVIKNGTYVNAMSTDLPVGNPLSRTQLAAFKSMVGATQTAWTRAEKTTRQLASR